MNVFGWVDGWGRSIGEYAKVWLLMLESKANYNIYITVPWQNICFGKYHQSYAFCVILICLRSHLNEMCCFNTFFLKGIGFRWLSTLCYVIIWKALLREFRVIPNCLELICMTNGVPTQNIPQLTWLLTHWSLNKMITISQKSFSNTFSCLHIFLILLGIST